jgi:hypothetical protein
MSHTSNQPDTYKSTCRIVISGTVKKGGRGPRPPAQEQLNYPLALTVRMTGVDAEFFQSTLQSVIDRHFNRNEIPKLKLPIKIKMDGILVDCNTKRFLMTYNGRDSVPVKHVYALDGTKVEIIAVVDCYTHMGYKGINLRIISLSNIP